MKRGTMMVLKRLFVTALSALGLVALTAGSAFAQIPPPNTFGGQDLTNCLVEPAGPRPDRPRSKVERDSGYTAATVAGALVTDFTGARRFTPKTGCETVQLGSGTAQATIDLIDMLAMAKEAYLDLPDMDDDDYAEELAAFNQKYSGAIFNALTGELSAQMDLDDAQDDLGDALDVLFRDHATNVLGALSGGTAVAINTLYGELTMEATAAADEDDVAMPTVTTGLSFTRNADDSVTADFSGAFETTASSSDDIDFDDSTAPTISSLLTLRQTSLDAIADANEALAGHAAEEYDFTSGQIDEIEEFKQIHEIRVRRLNNAIETIEGDPAEDSGRTLATGRDAEDIVDGYHAALDDIVREHANADGERRGLVDANSAYQAEFRNPISLLEALISAADNDLQEAIADGEAEADLRPLRTALANARAAKQAYDDAVADTDNPASALLQSLVAGDDTGQALIDAVSANHGSTVTNAEAIAALGDNTAEVAANTTKNTEQDTRLDNHEMRISDNETMLMDHEMRISTNASEIMRVEGRVDSNWDAIAQNQMDIGALGGRVGANEMAIGDLTNRVGSNAAAISRNEGMIGELSDSLEVVRAGVAASMALAGMPAINGRGVSIGIGSYDGESAFAVGFQIQGEMASFKVGVTSAGGETGASAGVGFQF